MKLTNIIQLSVICQYNSTMDTTGLLYVNSYKEGMNKEIRDRVIFLKNGVVG